MSKVLVTMDVMLDAPEGVMTEDSVRSYFNTNIIPAMERVDEECHYHYIDSIKITEVHMLTKRLEDLHNQILEVTKFMLDHGFKADYSVIKKQLLENEVII